jgi:hypothetical protein
LQLQPNLKACALAKSTLGDQPAIGSHPSPPEIWCETRSDLVLNKVEIRSSPDDGQCKQTFAAVGLALADILELRLYKGE